MKRKAQETLGQKTEDPVTDEKDSKTAAIENLKKKVKPKGMQFMAAQTPAWTGSDPLEGLPKKTLPTQGRTLSKAEQDAQDAAETAAFMGTGNATTVTRGSPEERAKQDADDLRVGKQAMEDRIRAELQKKYEDTRTANPTRTAIADYQKQKALEFDVSARENMGIEGYERLKAGIDQAAPAGHRQAETYIDGVPRVRNPVGMEINGVQTIRQPTAFVRDGSYEDQQLQIEELRKRLLSQN